MNLSRLVNLSLLPLVLTAAAAASSATETAAVSGDPKLQACQGGKPQSRGSNTECILKVQGFSQVLLMHATNSGPLERAIIVFHGMYALNPGEFNVTTAKFTGLAPRTLYVLPMEAGTSPVNTLTYFKSHTIAEFMDVVAGASGNAFLRSLRVAAVAGHSWGGKTIAEAVGPRNPSIPKFLLLDASYIYDDRRAAFESFVKTNHSRISCVYRNEAVLDRHNKDVSPAQGCLKNCTSAQPCLERISIPPATSHMQLFFTRLGPQTH